jgi:hypothetical protein
MRALCAFSALAIAALGGGCEQVSIRKRWNMQFRQAHSLGNLHHGETGPDWLGDAVRLALGGHA